MATVLIVDVVFPDTHYYNPGPEYGKRVHTSEVDGSSTRVVGVARAKHSDVGDSMRIEGSDGE